MENSVKQPLSPLSRHLRATVVWVTALTAVPSGALADPAAQLLAGARAEIIDIDTETLARRLAEDPNLLLIDVRTPAEVAARGGTIKANNNLVIPRGWLEFRIADQAPEMKTPIVVYCGTNQRSPLAAQTLSKMGYANVSNYAEGVFAWRDAGYPMEVSDKAPDSMLYSKPEQVTPDVWSAIGATAPPTYENSGHNNNLSFIVTDEGVMVVNAGDNYLLAQALHHEIKQITDRPVKYVVLENAQGHAMLGSNYWRQQGATIIAQREAAEVIRERGQASLERMRRGRRDKSMLTEVVVPDRVFDDRMVIELGGKRIEILRLGPAHSPGDTQVWLPDEKLIIAGDLAFHQRLLPVFEHTDTAAWIETWAALEALEPEIVIPGHGEPTDMAEVTRYTRDYLIYMRERIGELIEDGGDLQAAYQVDQSPYAHLDTFRELAKLNADRIFRAMEFE
jgi:glyoxylase-like metal-dependent hydrolase (beta-lactamase superfamily II)/rhodanese-related sulfurtransferase